MVQKVPVPRCRAVQLRRQTIQHRCHRTTAMIQRLMTVAAMAARVLSASARSPLRQKPAPPRLGTRIRCRAVREQVARPATCRGPARRRQASRPVRRAGDDDELTPFIGQRARSCIVAIAHAQERAGLPGMREGQEPLAHRARRPDPSDLPKTTLTAPQSPGGRKRRLRRICTTVPNFLDAPPTVTRRHRPLPHSGPVLGRPLGLL